MPGRATIRSATSCWNIRVSERPPGRPGLAAEPADQQRGADIVGQVGGDMGARARPRPPRRSPARRPRSPAAGRPTASASSASAGRQRRSRSTATTSAPAREQRAGQAARARARPRRRARPRASPGTRAIRSSNCSSSRKFWPSALDALSPCRAITSRSGGRSRHAVGHAARGAGGGHLQRGDHRARLGPVLCRRWRRRCRGRARCGRSAGRASC